MAPRIPGSKEEWEQLAPRDKRKVKEELLTENFSDLCETLSPQSLPNFSPVLHLGDLEELKLRQERNNKSSVITHLLLCLRRSWNWNPTWWQVLEKELGDSDLYFKMNPWESPSDGAKSSFAADGRKDAGCCNDDVWGRSPPHDGGSSSALTTGINIPYAWNTPLSATNGLPEFLKAVSETLRWQEQAEFFGLTAQDQFLIRNISADSSHCFLLLQLIKRYGAEATLGTVVEALLQLGSRGCEVVRQMVEKKVFQRIETEGSAAGGATDCLPCDNVGEDITSAQASQNSTLRFLATNPGTGRIAPEPSKLHLSSYSADSLNPNLEEKTSQGQSFPGNYASNLSKIQAEIGSCRADVIQSDAFIDSSSDSITDNTIQAFENNGNGEQGEAKLLNMQPNVTTETSDADCDFESPLAAGRSSSLQTDGPCSEELLLGPSDVSDYFGSSQQDKEDQLLEASGGFSLEQPQPSPLNETVPAAIYITFKNSKFKNIQIGESNKAIFTTPLLPEDDDDDDDDASSIPHYGLPAPVEVSDSEERQGLVHGTDAIRGTEVAEISVRYGQSASGTASSQADSFQPPPFDIASHQTEVKKVIDFQDETSIAQEHTRAEQNENELIVDLRSDLEEPVDLSSESWEIPRQVMVPTAASIAEDEVNADEQQQQQPGQERPPSADDGRLGYLFRFFRSAKEILEILE